MMDEPRALLENLVGEWDLTGQMGETPLQQAVTAAWALAGLFVEMHFTSLLPSPDERSPYEAVYFVSYNADRDLYVLHLLDTFGVPTRCIVGLGKRDGDAIPSVFDYAEGPFTNRFTWDAGQRTWTHQLTYEQDGRTATFATKRMVRREAQ